VPPATVALLWCRAVQHGWAVMIGVTAPDGSAFQTLHYQVRRGTETVTDGFDGRPVPRNRADDFPAALALAQDQGGPFQVIVSAPGAASLTLVGNVGDVVLGSGTVDRDGFGLLTLPETAHAWLYDSALVVTKDAAGRVIERMPYNGVGYSDPLGLDVDGPVV
jgi:hypothetical protein